MIARRLPGSLAVRVTLLCGFIVLTMTGMLGTYFFLAARTSITAHADEQLIARAEEFRRLAADANTLDDLRSRATLFEALLGSASDVLILRREHGAPFVEINPDHVPVPEALVPAPADRPIGTQHLLDVRDAAFPVMHWTAGFARMTQDGTRIEVLAAHPMASEMQMIRSTGYQALWSTIAAMVLSTLLVYLALRHGLRPLHKVAVQAALIDPLNLTIRLPEHDAPAELRDMVAVFNAMLDRIDGGYERLSQFSADLAHEIRTPVGALIGQTQVALSRSRSIDEYQELLESNLEELNRLRLIADNILFLAQADHAKLEIERTSLEIADELKRIADYFEGPAEEAGLQFAVQASGTARVNGPLCRRAIHNLVVNALRHGSPGSVVRLVGSEDGQGAVIAVENDGVPVPAEQLERLFERFYTGESGGARSAGSSGLGLAIVKAIMELHRGSASVSCTPAGMIRFELRFPR